MSYISLDGSGDECSVLVDKLVCYFFDLPRDRGSCILSWARTDGRTEVCRAAVVSVFYEDEDDDDDQVELGNILRQC